MSARNDFAAALVWARNEMRLTPRETCDRLGVNQKLLERFESGDELPDGATWSRYRNMVNKSLRNARYHELLGRARQEPLKVRPFDGKLAVVAIDTRQVAAIASAPAPSPAPSKFEQARAELLSRPGWRTDEAAAERQALARQIMRGDEHLTNDEIRNRVREKLGVGISDPTLAVIRKSMREEDKRREQRQERADRMAKAYGPPPVEPGSDARPIVPSTPTPRSAQDEIQAACELVLGAVPNLRTFTITVDDNGEAAVSYSVREVKVIETSGNLKIGRRS